MKRTITALTLCGALLCSGVPAMAAAPSPVLTAGESGSQTPQELPDSVLYYGSVQKIIADEDGTVTALWMDSDRYGEYVMKISPKTAWIDSGNRTASDPETLDEGERLYVFHSSVSTRSLPPQSEAFAVVRNIPQDASCAQYHKVEAVNVEDGTVRITTDNGGLFLLADEETSVISYIGGSPADLTKLKAGGHIMAWYGAYALSYPGQAHSSCIMVLDLEEQEPLTRAGFAALLHKAAGSPVVNYAMNYMDVETGATYAEAVRWVSSEGLMSGYGGGQFGPDDTINREQMVTVLWRYAGSPMLMDYPGLTQYEDVADIARYAQQAMAWAHQKGLLDTGSSRLKPHGSVTEAEAGAMLNAMNPQK